MTLKPVKIRMSLNIELLFLHFTIKDRKICKIFQYRYFQYYTIKKRGRFSGGAMGAQPPLLNR